MHEDSRSDPRVESAHIMVPETDISRQENLYTAGGDEPRTIYCQPLGCHPFSSSAPSSLYHRSMEVGSNGLQGSARNKRALTREPTRDLCTVRSGHGDASEGGTDGRARTHLLNSSEKGSSFRKTHGSWYLRLNLSSNSRTDCTALLMSDSELVASMKNVAFSLWCRGGGVADDSEGVGRSAGCIGWTAPAGSR